MKKFFAAAVLSAIAIGGVHAEDAASSQVIELFTCKLQPGKTMENVWGLMDGLRDVSNSMESDDESASVFLWTSFRGEAPYDYIVGLSHSGLNDMAAGLSRYYGSGVGASFDARFQSVGECNSYVAMSKQIRNGEIGNTGDRQLDAIVETFVCGLNEGSDMDDVDDAIEFWNAQIEKIGSPATSKYEAYLYTPFRGGSGQTDFMWVGLYPDLATWAQGDTDYYGSKAGQAADERLNSLGTCGSALWIGYWIVPPQGGPAAR